MIDVIVMRGVGDKTGSEIRDSVIRTEAMARIRGKAYIDENWYKIRKRKVMAPFKHGLVVNAVVSASAGMFGIFGNHLVTGFSIKASQEGLHCEVDIEQHSEGR